MPERPRASTAAEHTGVESGEKDVSAVLLGIVERHRLLQVQRVLKPPRYTKLLEMWPEQLDDLVEQLLVVTNIDPERERSAQQAFGHVRVIKDDRLREEFIAKCAVPVKQCRIGCNTE
jgi:hypothetical protein